MVLWLKEMSSLQEVSDQLRLKPACSANNRPAQLMRLANLEVINLGGKVNVIQACTKPLLFALQVFTLQGLLFFGW